MEEAMLLGSGGMENEHAYDKEPKSQCQGRKNNGDDKARLAGAEHAAGTIPVTNGNVDGCGSEKDGKHVKQHSKNGQRHGNAVVARARILERSQLALFLSRGEAVGAEMFLAELNGTERANQPSAAVTHALGLLLRMIKTARFRMVDQGTGKNRRLDRAKESRKEIGLDPARALGTGRGNLGRSRFNNQRRLARRARKGG